MNSISAIILMYSSTFRAFTGKSSFHFVMKTKNCNVFISPHKYFRPEARKKLRTRLVLATTVKPVETTSWTNFIA